SPDLGVLQELPRVQHAFTDLMLDGRTLRHERLQGMKKGAPGRDTPWSSVGEEGAGAMQQPPGSVAGSSPQQRRRPGTGREHATRILQFLTGPGLIRLRIRGRNGDLESHQQNDANVVYEGLKPSFSET
ncbi:hypothetical protein, partial [uncultured Brevundimonas sp.]|uniref:hypothetical protein n=1 Tax=uncultured Brevundimonas sp. TaxID=213418 RepID=UPI002603955F